VPPGLRELHVRVADVEVETVDVALSYDPADPFAVRVDINGRERDLTWIFGRDLLSDGLRSMVPIGDGDVQVQAALQRVPADHVVSAAKIGALLAEITAMDLPLPANPSDDPLLDAEVAMSGLAPLTAALALLAAGCGSDESKYRK